MKRIHLFSLAILLALSVKVNAQCSSCTINITGIDTSSYTLEVGSKLCIDTTGIITGIVVMNGGTVCNNGIFKPVSFTYNSGNLENQGNMTINSDIVLPGSHSLSNSLYGIITIRGNATINGSSVTNNGILNVNQNIIFNSGTFVNDNIINALFISGSGTISNTGTINTNN